jgi:hypothetical protein
MIVLFRAISCGAHLHTQLPIRQFCRHSADESLCGSVVRLGETSWVWSGLDVANASRPRSLLLRRLKLPRWLHVRVDAARDRDLAPLQMDAEWAA